MRFPIKHAGSPATPRQSTYYTQLTGQPLPQGATRQDASDLIAQALIKTLGAGTGKAAKTASAKRAAVPRPTLLPKAPVYPWPPANPVIRAESVEYAGLVPKTEDDDIAGFVVREPYWRQVNDAYERRMPLLLTGEAGTGKSTLPRALAHARGLPHMLISADNDLSTRELFGQVNIKDGTSFFVEGLFTKLSQVPALIHVSEFNAMDAGRNMVWQQINNDRRFYVKDAEFGKGKTYTLHEDCWIVFDGNPPSARYNGSNRYNVAQLDRLAVVEVGQWTRDEVMALLSAAKDAEKLVEFYLAANEAIRKDGYRAMVSIRGVKRVAALLEDGYAEPEALAIGVLNQVGLTGGDSAHEAVKAEARKFFKL